MPRVCYLHLGMHKTGSTSIQSSCDGYSDKNTVYLQLDGPNHSQAMANLFSECRDSYGFNRKAGRQGKQLARHVQQLRSRFERALSEDNRNLVISGEGLTTLLNAAEVEAMIAVLRPHFDEVQALAYVRAPYGFMCSEMQQMVKAGVEQLNPALMGPKYRDRFQKWDQALSEAHVRLVPFSREFFKGGELLLDFVDWAGLAPDRLHSGRARKNTSLSAQAAALVYSANRHKTQMKMAGFDLAANNNLVRALLGFGSGKAVLDFQVAQREILAQKQDIDWVANRIGHAFPKEHPPAGAVSFSDYDRILACAIEALPAAKDWIETSQSGLAGWKRHGAWAAGRMRAVLRRDKGRAPVPNARAVARDARAQLVALERILKS